MIRKPIQVVSHQKLFGIDGNRQNKLASRIVRVHPRVFINSRRPSIRVRVLLRLIYQEQFRRSSVCETPTREINHTFAIWLLSFLFLLVFFVAQAGISLLGEVNLVRDSVDNQRSSGAKIAGFDLSI